MAKNYQIWDTYGYIHKFPHADPEHVSLPAHNQWMGFETTRSMNFATFNGCFPCYFQAPPEASISWDFGDRRTAEKIATKKAMTGDAMAPEKSRVLDLLREVALGGSEAL